MCTYASIFNGIKQRDTYLHFQTHVGQIENYENVLFVCICILQVNVLTLVCEGGVDFGDKGHWWVLALGTGCDWNVGLLASHT